MGGNMMRMLLMMLVTSWIWWGATSVSGAAAVSFTTEEASEKTYTKFLVELRAQLASGFVKNGFALMRRKSAVHNSEQRFLLVNLTNPASKNITLALDVVTAQVVGYQARDDRSFFFKDAPKPQSEDLFLDTERTTFKFTGSYADLAQVAGADRDSIALGMTPLSDAIHDLHVWKSGSRKNLATGLIVIIQMVAEAAKIPYIQRAVANQGLGDDYFTPDCAAISYEDNWGLLASAIQTLVNGTFQTPIELERGNCEKYNVTQVTENLQQDLALLKNNLATSPSSQVIRSVVAAEDEENINGRHNKWFTIQA